MTYRSKSQYTMPSKIGCRLEKAQTNWAIQIQYSPTRASEAEAVGQISLDSVPELLLLLLWDEFGLIVVSLELLVGTADLRPIGGALCAVAAATFAATVSL